MNLHARKNASPTDDRVAPPGGRRLGLLVAGPAVALLAACIGCGPTGNQEAAPAPPAAPPAEQAAPPDAEPAPAAERKTELKTLEGRWLRADGGYVVEIRRADSDGRLDAAYYNPSPIHVAQARAADDHGLLRVFVELRDQGYPGCKYELTYDHGNDCLAGTYFQAAMGETYNVIFTRQKP